MDEYYQNIDNVLNETIEKLNLLIPITLDKIRENYKDDNNKLRANIIKLNTYRDVIYKIYNINKKSPDELLKLINSINEEVISNNVGKVQNYKCTMDKRK